MTDDSTHDNKPSGDDGASAKDDVWAEDASGGPACQSGADSMSGADTSSLSQDGTKSGAPPSTGSSNEAPTKLCPNCSAVEKTHAQC